MNGSLRILVVDDEPAARGYLRALLLDDPDVGAVEECGNGRDAVDAIVARAPDLVLLDIQMPELDGFEVVREVVRTAGTARLPVIVFVTAHDEHALAAFRAHAFDYLLKPVGREAFAESLARAKRQVQLGRAGELDARLLALLERAGAAERPRAEPEAERLALKVDGRILFVDPRTIDWIEARDDHARLHLGRQLLEVRDTLSRLEDRLSSARFMRIHRSTIVNLERVREVQPWFQGDFAVILTDGTRLTSGRSFRARLQEYLRKVL